MAIIKCPECGKEISDKAEICPNCGFSLVSSNNSILNKDDVSTVKKQWEGKICIVTNVVMK